MRGTLQNGRVTTRLSLLRKRATGKGASMKRFALVTVALVCGMAAATGATAQSRGRGRDAPRASSGQDDGLAPNVAPRVSTLPPTRGIAGPRIEPGAVLCSSEQNLQRRSEISRRIADGDADAGDPLSGCRLLSQERGVEVLSRHGMGRIQVKVKPSGEVGWTDAYLP